MTDPPGRPDSDSPPAADRRRRVLLLASVFLVGACGLVYELGLGAVASYLMGNSVTQYSLVIGAFLASMGLGSWLTQWVRHRLLGVFLRIQLVVGVAGGFSALAMFAAFAHAESITAVTLACTALVGTLVGMEIPLMFRILHHESALRVTAAQVLSLDYLGALAASAAFPFLLLPLLGLTRASLACGALNLLVGSLGTALFWNELEERRRLLGWNVVAWGLLGLGLSLAQSATTWLEDRLYQDEIILAETTPYQRIVVTRWRDDYRLHLDGHLQFSSKDEYRYHEALVLPALGAALGDAGNRQPLRVLVLGGGDGMAARELLASPRVGHLDLVDIDPRIVELFRDNPTLRRLNGGALSDPRVEVHFQDAMVYLRRSDASRHDVVIMDLPDPASVETNKLYAKTFFSLALRRLTDRGVLVTQASSPFYARRAYWCVVRTLQAAVDRRPAGGPRGPLTLVPYHVYVPSFGDWGFVMAGPRGLCGDDLRLPRQGRYLTDSVFAQARVFPPDSERAPTEINRLDNPVLLRYHAADWSRWGE